MSATHSIVIGASTGGIDPLQRLVQDLPRTLSAAVFIVVHTSPNSPGLLADILAGPGSLPVCYGRDGEQFQDGHIYLAPADHHMLIETPDRIRISRGPKENGFRPAIDPLFRSAALNFSPRVVGVVLSGNLDDGTVGLVAIKRRGGIAIVQNPSDARAPSMPLSALRHVKVDHCADIAQMGALLAEVVHKGEPSKLQSMEAAAMADQLKYEVDIVAQTQGIDPTEILTLGDPSLFTCPDCHGALVQLREDGPLRFRCHTGHAFTAGSLVAALNESTEEALWSTFRALQEKIVLLRHLSAHARDHQQDDEARKLLREAQNIQKRARLVRQALLAEEGTASSVAVPSRAP